MFIFLLSVFLSDRSERRLFVLVAGSIVATAVMAGFYSNMAKTMPSSLMTPSDSWDEASAPLKEEIARLHDELSAARKEIYALKHNESDVSSGDQGPTMSCELELEQARLALTEWRAVLTTQLSNCQASAAQTEVTGPDDTPVTAPAEAPAGDPVAAGVPEPAPTAPPTTPPAPSSTAVAVAVAEAHPRSTPNN